jgi:hypothetical protein
MKVIAMKDTLRETDSQQQASGIREIKWSDNCRFLKCFFALAIAKFQMMYCV